MHVGAPSRHPPDHQVSPDHADAHEHALGLDGPTANARPLRDVRGFHRLYAGESHSLGPALPQDETSESQLIARWRSRARSPMSIPVVVAICSIGVLMRSSGEWTFAV